MPGGQFSVRTPHSCTIGLLGIGEVGNPDVVVAVHRRGPRPGKAAALNGEPGYCVPSGRSSVTLPPYAASLLLGHRRRQVVGRRRDTLQSSGVPPCRSRCAMPSSPLPNRLVTQTLPWLSMARPLLLIAGLEVLDLARVGGGKARDVVDSRYWKPISGPAGRCRGGTAPGTTCTAQRCRPRRRSGPSSGRPWGK